MTVWRRIFAAGTGGLLVAALGGCTHRWDTELLSVNAAGTDSAAGFSSNGRTPFTPDGTKVVFASRAGDFGPTDTNGLSDIYIRDLTTGTTSLVSSNSAGTDAANGSSEQPQLSADGTKVAFVSGATDLGPTATRTGIYVRDLVAGTTTLVTVNGEGTDASDGFLYDYELSADGTKVLWPTSADDLGPADHDRPPYSPEPTNDHDDTDVYVRDLVTQTTSLVSVNAAGTDSADAMTQSAWFGPDSNTVNFYSAATDLIAGDTNNKTDAFTRDLTTGITTRIEQSPTASSIPTYSPDGSKMFFTTVANDLGPVDSDCTITYMGVTLTDKCSDVYVRDFATGATEMVTVNAAGTDSANGNSTFLGVSPDGNRVFFRTDAGDLGPPDAGQDLDIYVRDLAAGTTSLVTVNGDGTDGLNTENWAIYVVLSPDGNRVAFGTMATNLGPVDTNDDWDVYVRDLGAETTALVSHTADGADSGNGRSLPTAFSPDGTRIVFSSSAGDLVPVDTNGTYDFFIAAPHHQD